MAPRHIAIDWVLAFEYAQNTKSENRKRGGRWQQGCSRVSPVRRDPTRAVEHLNVIVIIKNYEFECKEE